jgi:fructose-1,6-bisphosphatase/inositol monophosphatase family enzyme
MDRTTTDDELRHAERVAHELAEAACEAMRTRHPGTHRYKAGPADIVTDTDEAIESHVRQVLRREFPGHWIEGEEYGVHTGEPGAPRWVVDPVDGTTNYAHGIGWSSFSLGLSDAAGRGLLGLVADPYRREVFTALRGRGARLNGEPIHAAGHDGLRGHVVMTEWAAHAPWPGMQALLAELSRRWCTVRVMGSTALSLAQVAAGRAVAAMIGAFHAVDGMPALLIGREAGALAYDDHGATDGVPRGGLLLTAPGTAPEVSALWLAARGLDADPRHAAPPGRPS